MRFPTSEEVERLKKQYPVGMRIVLCKMDDDQAPPVGTKGTVKGVDDIGSLIVKWDNGCGLSVAYGVDEVEKLDSVTTVCYGQERVWDSQKRRIIFSMAYSHLRAASVNGMLSSMPS